MYCRTCGNKINDNAEICVKCGVRRNVGEDFCQACGAKTVAGMTVCKKCGKKLMKALSSAQMKEKTQKTANKARRVIGTILVIFGVVLLVSAVLLILVALSAHRTTLSSMSRGRMGIRWFFLGIFNLIIGLIIKGRKKK